MSSEWRVERLGDTCLKIGSGSTPTGGKDAYLEHGPFTLIRSQNIYNDGFSASGLAFISETQAKKLDGVSVESNDVLLNITGDSVARVCLAPSVYLPARVNQHVAIIRPNPQIFDSRYLRYFLASPEQQNFMLGLASAGATRPALTKAMIDNFKIPCPPMKVQQSIAENLSSLDDRIALLRETNATLEAIAQAIFKSWFVDFDPVRAKQEGRVPEGMDEATAALFPDSFEESELGLVPKGWRVEKFESWISALETGRRPKGGVSGIESGVPSIGAESIIRIGQFDYSKTKYVSYEFFAKMKSGILESRDVLLYKDGGKPGVFLPRVSMFGDGFPYKICGINEHVFRIRLRDPFNQTFLYFWLWSDAVMHELKHRGGKAAIPGINQSDVKEQRLLFSGESVLKKFDEITSPLITRILANAKLIDTLSNIRDTLLPRLISGQLRLPEAEAMLEKV